jgi:serine/threonine protein kinase
MKVFLIHIFIFLKVVGRGSFGKVFMVKKKGEAKLYAMKVLKKENIRARNQTIHTKGSYFFLLHSY